MHRARAKEADVLAIIGTLLIIWLAFIVLGIVLKSLFWLAIIGGVLFLGTLVYGAFKGKSTS